MYRLVGNPDLPDEPLTARLNEAPADMDVAAAVAKIEAHLAQHPDDGKAYEVIAPIYLNLGRADDAVNAYANALRLLGDTPERLEAYGGALVFAAGDQVTPKARRDFQGGACRGPGAAASAVFPRSSPPSRMATRPLPSTSGRSFSPMPRPMPSGRISCARRSSPTAAIRRLRSSPPADSAAAAPEDRLASPPAAEAASVAALPADEQQKFIRNMVDGLAERLHQDGHDVEGWLRLVRAYTVLQETDKARAALADARKSLGSDSAALARLDQLAHELGLEG